MEAESEAVTMLTAGDGLESKFAALDPLPFATTIVTTILFAGVHVRCCQVIAMEAESEAVTMLTAGDGLESKFATRRPS
jgi:hypothetical protein